MRDYYLVQAAKCRLAAELTQRENLRQGYTETAKRWEAMAWEAEEADAKEAEEAAHPRLLGM